MIQRRLKRNALALILDDAACRGRIGDIRDRQRHICALGLPHGIQRGILCEFSSSTRLDLLNRVVGIRSICLAVLAPTEELVARADRELLDDRVVDRRWGVQIVLYSLRLGHTGHVIARIRIIDNRHGLALDAGDGDLGVRLRDELVGVGITGDILGGEQHAVETDQHLRCVIALVDLDGEGHHGFVGNGAGVGGQFRRGRATGLGVLDLHGVARRRGGPSDLRGDGIELGVERGGFGHLVGGEIPLVGIGPTRVLIPAAEREAIDLGVSGAGGNRTLLHLLFSVERTSGSLKGHGEHQVLADAHRNDLIGHDAADGIGVAHRLIAVRGAGGGTQGAAAVNGDRGILLRIFTGHGDGKLEVAAVRNRCALLSADAIALAGGQGDSVGVLFPHGVEGDGAIHGIHIAGLIAGGGGLGRRAPAEEGEALAGGNFRAQRHRLTVLLGLSGGGSTRSTVQVIRNGIGVGRQLAVEDGILIDQGVKIERSTVGILICGVPAVKLIALADGVDGGLGCLSAAHYALREELAGLRDRKGHIVVRDRAFHDHDTLRAGDVFDGVFTIRPGGLLYAVDVHGNSVALIRRNGEGVVAAIDDAGRLSTGSYRGAGGGSGGNGGSTGDLSVEVTGRHHNGKGLLGHRADMDRHLQHAAFVHNNILCHEKLVMERNAAGGVCTL